MKAKQIKRSILAILMIAVLMVGTSVVSVGAATQKTYLDSLSYTEETNAVKYGVCNLTKFDGGFTNTVAHADCKNALRIDMNTDESYYQENSDRAMYKVTYNLNKCYEEFYAGLISSPYSADFVNVKVYTDEICVYDNNLTGSSDYQNICVNVKNYSELTFVMSFPFPRWQLENCQVIIDNAYLTSEGTTPEPTTKVPDTTQKTTQAPTKPVENPTTVAPTTKNPVVTPTKNVEDTTETSSSEETTSSKINPTASTNATSKISTSDTATKDGANKGIANISNNKGNSDNSTIQTGAVSIAVVLFVILASLATGGFVWYRRKIK